MPKGKSLKLHKEFGLNPTISQCILCGEDKNELVLLGAAYKEQAPMRMITTVEPCDACRKTYLSRGVMLVEAEVNDKGQRIPTGPVMVLKDAAFKRIFSVPLPEGRIAFASKKVFRLLQKEVPNDKS